MPTQLILKLLLQFLIANRELGRHTGWKLLSCTTS